MKIALVAQQAMTLSGDGTGQAGDTRLRELSRSLASKGHQAKSRSATGNVVMS